ncbi:cytochrome b/b6 domain-containing protein [Methyloversatilis universalis]|uniref:cytochrome b/b6 domain-containing protein n=1 Tax=Methyloversatilis universalis TaxID=378211 RepID=UPI0003747A5A|nr:cytochrome b/b6 domain-containing protein [Methyloversatilis universalis]
MHGDTADIDDSRWSLPRRLTHGLLALAVVFQTFSPEWMSKPWREGDAAGRLMFELHEWGGLIAGLAALAVAAGLWQRRGAGRAGLNTVLAQFRLVLGGLTAMRVPPAAATQTLARTVQVLGLALIGWFCATGAAIWWVGAASDTAHRIGDLHELAAPLLYLYLGGHIGMALLHRLAGTD